MIENDDPDMIPLIEEFASIDKRTVVTGRVRVQIVTRESEEAVRENLMQEHIEVIRVAKDLQIETVPEIRQEGEVTIVPVIEEVLHIEKRLVLKEEIHIRRTRTMEPTETTVVLRRQEAVVDHAPADISKNPRED